MNNDQRPVANNKIISNYRHSRTRKAWSIAFVLSLCLVCTGVWRITSGEWDIPLPQVVHYLSPWLDEAESFTAQALVVRAVRVPRLFAAIGAGGLLSASGTVLQGLLSNPLAEPYTLGIAAGAAFGGAIGILIGDIAGMTNVTVTLTAFIGAIGALCLVGLIAWRGGGAQLVLAGIVANAVLSAGVTFLKAIAGDKLGAIVLWLMGSLAGAGATSALTVWLGCLIVLIPALICAPMLDAMSLGRERGSMLGVNELHVRILLLLTTSLGVAAAVSSFGIIGFVGLVVPHLLRMSVGPSHRILLLLSTLTGGCLLALADGVAQSMGELPVGVLTALIGGPFFCWLLVRRKS